MSTRNPTRALAALALAALAAPTIACDDDTGAGQGRLAITIYGEEFIEEGIPAGEPGCDGCVEDGWTVTFERFLIVVAAVEIPGEARDDTARVFDLARTSGGAGHPVVTLDLPAAQYSALDYTIAPAAAPTAGNASEADVAYMRDEGLAVYAQGRAERAGEVRTFAWGFAETTRYSACEIDARVVDGGEAAAELTIHADHLLYDDLDSGEPQVVFDLIAASDGDGDGEITRAELEARDISAESRYQVGSRSIDDLWAFIAAQTATLGHIDGEGHCDQQ